MTSYCARTERTSPHRLAGTLRLGFVQLEGNTPMNARARQADCSPRLAGGGLWESVSGEPAPAARGLLRDGRPDARVCAQPRTVTSISP